MPGKTTEVSMRQPSVLYVGAGSLALQVAGLLPEWGGWALRRSQAALPASLQWLPADVTQPECPDSWPRHTPDYVVISLVPAARNEAAYRTAYVEGTRHVLAWLREHGQQPRRILFVSSIGVYGQSAGEWVDESSVAEPERWSGQVMLDAEQLLMDSGIPVTSVRLAGIYGGPRRHFLERVRQGYHADGQSNRWTNRIHERDAAALLAQLLRLDADGKLLEPVYIGVDDEPVEQAAVVGWLQQQLGVTSQPDCLLANSGTSKRCSNRLARSTGWVPEFANFREGYLPMLARQG